MTTIRIPPGSITAEELIERHRQSDPEFRERWDRSAFAREISFAVIRYRNAHDLDLEQLANRLGVELAVVESLEDGEDDPEIGTLRLLAAKLGLRFTLDIHPGPDADTGVAEVSYSVA